MCAVAPEWAENVQRLLFVRTFQIQVHLCLSLTHDEFITFVANQGRPRGTTRVIFSFKNLLDPTMYGARSRLIYQQLELKYLLSNYHRHRPVRTKNYIGRKRGRGEAPLVLKLTARA